MNRLRWQATDLMIAAGVTFAMLLLGSGLWVSGKRTAPLPAAAPAAAIAVHGPAIKASVPALPAPSLTLPAAPADGAPEGLAVDERTPNLEADEVMGGSGLGSAAPAVAAQVRDLDPRPEGTDQAAAVAADSSMPRGRLAIVIDDIGWERGSGERSLALPAPITLAVLPGTPLAQELSERAYAQGHEVILHQPMAALGGGDLGPGALQADLSDADMVRIFEANLEGLPHLAGFSNHMGSRLTASSAAMNVLMDAAQLRGLYFLDSRTTAATVALSSARAHAIPATRRDVFLDTERTPEAIEAALEKAVRLAEQRGHAVAIGHPHAQTLEILERLLGGIGKRVQLVPVSALLETRGRETNAGRPPVAVPQEGVGGD